MGGTKSQAPTTKEFVIYSCNICGFNKKKFAVLLDYTRQAPPDAMVLNRDKLVLHIYTRLCGGGTVENIHGMWPLKNW